MPTARGNWRTKARADDPATSGGCPERSSTAYGFAEEVVPDQINSEERVTRQACHGPGERDDPKDRLNTEKRVRRAVKRRGLIIAAEANSCLPFHNESSPTHGASRYTLGDGTRKSLDFEQTTKEIEHKVAGKE